MSRMLGRAVGLLSVLLLLALALGVVWARYNTRDRNPGYRVDLRLEPASPALLRIGFAALPVAPPRAGFSPRRDEQRFSRPGVCFRIVFGLAEA